MLSATTNEAGFFSFIAVRPDTYDISVESKGFTKSMMRLVKVAPIQETGLPPIKLEVQSATVSVEVTADANQLLRVPDGLDELQGAGTVRGPRGADT